MSQIGRPTATTVTQKNMTESDKPSSDSHDTSNSIGPRHVALPQIPLDSDVFFHFMVFVYCVTATGLQFLLLYRTVWWLPHSYVNYAINAYLIDGYLAAFIITVLSRQLLLSMLKEGTKRIEFLSSLPATWVKTLATIGKTVFYVLFLTSIIWLASNVVHQWVSLWYICYPIGLHVVLFGLDIAPFFELNDGSTSGKFKSGLQHSCSHSASACRREVELFRTDFNNRLKRVLYNSILCAYFSTFLPCSFAPSTLYYDVARATQNCVFVWISCFAMFVVQLYTPEYSDILHRAALHLGSWQKVTLNPRSNSVVPNGVWSEDVQCYLKGVVVKHRKETYKAVGVYNVAQPGNMSQARFYMLFCNPSTTMGYLFGLQVTITMIELACLAMSSEWYRIISLALLLFANFYIVFKLLRDYLVLWKVYRTEAVMQVGHK